MTEDKYGIEGVESSLSASQSGPERNGNLIQFTEEKFYGPRSWDSCKMEGTKFFLHTRTSLNVREAWTE